MQTRPSTRRPMHRQGPRLRFSALLAVLAVLAVAIWGWRTEGFGLFSSDRAAQGSGRSPGGGSGTHPTHGTPGGSTQPSGSTGGSSGGSPAGGITTPGPINTKYPGLTTFRGNATRDYYGEGPVPTHPVVR